MSGGHYNYAYCKLDEFADALEVELAYPPSSSDLRARFADHCRLVALAMRACEWNDSGDGDDDEARLIRQVLGDDNAA